MDFVNPLITQAVKIVYEKWKERGTAELELSEEASRVLRLMQSDPTDNGVFQETRGIGRSTYPMHSCYSDLRIETTRRVIAELEAKGIITVTRNTGGHGAIEKVTLTHFGWILNPTTGKVDKAG